MLPEQNLGFQAGAGAELDQHAAVRHAVDDLGGVRIEDRSFRPRRIVLGQPRDLLEQLAAARVVEEAAGQGLARPRQPIQDGAGKIVPHRRAGALAAGVLLGSTSR